MPQMVFPFPQKADYSAASYYPTQSSEAVRALLHTFNHGIFCLYGPAGSGKTHLLHMWAEGHGTQMNVLDAETFVAVDDIDKLDKEGQVNLFHWLNNAGKNGGLLVASRKPISESPDILPDLASRLNSGTAAEVLPPGEAELKQICQKWAAERQLKLSGEVLDYVLARAERSVPALRALVTALDELSLEEKRAITVPLARKVLSDS